MKSHVIPFSVLSAREGGIGQREALRRLKEVGILAFPWPSAYVGHVGVGVRTHNRRTLRRIQNILYS